MDAEKSLTESAPTPTATYCGRNKSDNGSFVSNLRDHLHEFIHSPMEEHKACLKANFQKIIGKFSERTTGPKEGENSLHEVIERLDAEKSLTESAPTPTVTYCQRNKSDNDIFVSNLRHHLHELIHSPMEEHKACLKATFQKIMGKFSERTTIPKEGEKSLPLETTAKN